MIKWFKNKIRETVTDLFENDEEVWKVVEGCAKEGVRNELDNGTEVSEAVGSEANTAIDEALSDYDMKQLCEDALNNFLGDEEGDRYIREVLVEFFDKPENKELLLEELKKSQDVHGD